MDNTAPIFPVFNNRDKHAVASLCDFFMIWDPSQVPVIQVIIVVDGTKHVFPVTPIGHSVALFLLYCAVLRQATSFRFDTDLFSLFALCFANASKAEIRQTPIETLVLEDEHSPEVHLVLEPGYELPKYPGRTMKQLIEYGWARHESGSLTPDAPVPLIRDALRMFQRAEHNRTIRIIQSWDPLDWPSSKWQNRVGTLLRRLNMWQDIKPDS